MASKIPQLQAKVTQASQVVANHGGSYYKLLLEQNKHYIQDPPTIEKCQSLAKQLFYTRLASIPLRYNSFLKELEYAKNIMKNRKDLNIENVGIGACFGLECVAWFCGGEIAATGGILGNSLMILTKRMMEYLRSFKAKTLSTSNWN